MATYEYRCPQHGSFSVARTIGTADEVETCGECGADATRVFSAPHLTRTTGAMARALGAEDKSRDQPEVVTEVPPALRRTNARHVHGAGANPAWSKLPAP